MLPFFWSREKQHRDKSLSMYIFSVKGAWLAENRHKVLFVASATTTNPR
jgi:hypothetical protein